MKKSAFLSPSMNKTVEKQNAHGFLRGHVIAQPLLVRKGLTSGRLDRAHIHPIVPNNSEDSEP